MAEITRKRVGELQRSVFKMLLDQPEGLPAKEVLKRLEQRRRPARINYAVSRRFS